MRITNFRDLGGMAADGGKHVRPHRLLRSGQLVGLDQESAQTLTGEYGLSRVVDFRRPFEIQEDPDDDIKGVSFTNIDLLGMIGARNTSLDDFASLGSVAKVNDHMLGTYHDMVLNPGAQRGFGQFLDLVLDNSSGATLFHCFAGKDRTGFAAALILSLLQVDDEQIMADYMKTNQERVVANTALVSRFRAKGYDQESLDALAVALYVKKEYLEYAFELIFSQYGDVCSYARQALGFSRGKIESLRQQLLV